MATTVSLKPNAVEISGSTSGTTTLQATAVAGTTTLTLPAATDTLVGKATTDTLTNKTLTGAAMNGTLGATTPSTVAATTLTTSSTVTHNGGTANGVGYLDGSKVLTTGSALVFDGANLGVGVTPSAWDANVKPALQWGYGGTARGALFSDANSSIWFAQNMFYNTSSSPRYIASKYANMYIQDGNAGGHIWNTAPSGTAGNAITFTQAMTLDASGNLLVGSSTSLYASGKLQISSGKTIINSTDSAFGQFQLGNATSNGEVSIQFLSNVATFGGSPTSTSGDNHCWNIGAGNYAIGGDSFGVANKGNGGINVKLAYNSSSWISVSDERIKDIQSDITNAYEIVKDWRTVYYTLKSDPLKITKIGLLAQDVQKTLPAAVDIPKTETDDKGKLNPWGVHYTDVIPVLVKAIQEQQALITQLTARITALESA